MLDSVGLVGNLFLGGTDAAYIWNSYSISKNTISSAASGGIACGLVGRVDSNHVSPGGLSNCWTGTQNDVPWYHGRCGVQYTNVCNTALDFYEGSETLGTAFEKDDSGINNGYPVFKWQSNKIEIN